MGFFSFCQASISWERLYNPLALVIPELNNLIFFIHGLGCAKESFDDVFLFPEFNSFSLLTVDLVGFGNSSKPQDFSYSMEDQAKICELLIAKINPTSVHIVGHSMGGAVGLLLANRISHKLVTFVNVEGNLISEDCGLLSRKTIGIPLEEFINNGFNEIKSNVRNSGDEGSMLWVKWSEKSDALGFYKSAKSLVEWSDSGKLLEMFKTLEINKAYLHGERNSHLRVLGELHGITKISISNSGHFVMNDNPREFYSELFNLVTRGVD